MLSNLTDAYKGRVELTALAVSPSHQRRGVGRAMLREAIRRARRLNANYMVLHTAKQNCRARALFESEGFRYNRILENFYPNGQAAQEMILDLSGAEDARKVNGEGFDSPDSSSE